MADLGRTIVVGKNSRVWRSLSHDPRLTACIAIGHADVADFGFSDTDQVWILSYSRDMTQNRALFAALARAGGRRCIYVSTATANVDVVTQCYEYPRIKRACEQMCRTENGACIVSIGVVYQSAADLPAGTTIATSLDQLAEAIATPVGADEDHINLFEPITRPFGSDTERVAFRLYGIVQKLAGGWPCLLRPLDLVLRTLGWRWYGYLYLSNRLWLTTTS
ncbi:MAG: hypothetical protein RLW68_18715 [Devosia marina]|uniref:hypothetical protein n=1 Tax=Devosia marina TaxID=2683198 RepID=UPI0032EFFB5C